MIQIENRLRTSFGEFDSGRSLGLATAHVFVVVYLLVNLFEPFSRVRGVPDSVRFGLVPMLGVIALVLAWPDRTSDIPRSAALLAYVGWAVLSLTWTTEWDAGVEVLQRDFLPLILISLVAGTLRPHAVITTLTATFVGVGAFSLVHVMTSPYARSQMIGVDRDILQVGWLAGFPSKNFLGPFAVMGLVLVVAFVPQHWLRGAVRGALAAMFVLLVIGSRSATAGFGLVAAVAAWSTLIWSRPFLGHVRRATKGVRAVALVGAVFAVVALVPLLMRAYGKDSTFTQRTIVWRESIRIIRDAPVVGHGIGAVWADGSAPISRLLETRIGFNATHAHNGVLDVWVSFGVVGVVLILVLLVQIAILAHRALVRGGPTAEPYGRWGLTTLAALMVMAIPEPMFRQGTLGILVIVWVVLTIVTRDDASPSSRVRVGAHERVARLRR